MFPYSELLPHAQKKRRPITSAVANDATPGNPLMMPITALVSRLASTRNYIPDIEQRQIRHRRGQRGNELKREKRELVAEQARLTQTLATLTATPKEEKKTNPIVHDELRRKTLVDYLPTSLIRSFSMAGFALSVLLTPQAVALAQDGQPTPEASGSIPLTQRYTLLYRKTDKGLTVSAKSDPKFWNEPNLTVGQVVSAVSNKFGIADQKSCAAKIVFDNNYNIETESTAQRRLNRKEVLPSERQIVIESAQTVIDFINACSLKAKQVISTLLPTITTISPSKVAPPTVMATRIPASSTPVKLPTTTSTPQAEVPSSTDTGEYIKYGLGGALVIALLGLGSLAALVVHKSKSEGKKEELSPVTLRRLPNEPVVNDPRVINLSGQSHQPFEVYVGEGEPDIPAIFEPRVMVTETNDLNLLQRVLNSLARAIKREDSDINPAKARVLMEHEGDHAKQIEVAIIGFIRNPSGRIIGAGVKNGNPSPTPEEQVKMFLGPNKPSAHDRRNAELERKDKKNKNK